MSAAVEWPAVSVWEKCGVKRESRKGACVKQWISNAARQNGKTAGGILFSDRRTVASLPFSHAWAPANKAAARITFIERFFVQ